MKNFALCLIMVLGLVMAQTESNETAADPPQETVVDPLSKLVCGSQNTPGVDKLKTWSGVWLCLVFTMPDNSMKKVLYQVRYDKFTALEIQGLYDIFKDVSTASVRAVSNGLLSRETRFKVNNGVAEILNLVVSMKDGAITGLEWKNQCIEKVCSLNDCET